MDKLNRNKKRKYSIQYFIEIKELSQIRGDLVQIFCAFFSNILRRIHCLHTQEFFFFNEKLYFWCNKHKTMLTYVGV